MHLRTISHLAQTFQTPVGLSDHTMGVAVPAAAVALGACIVEKHITMSRSIPGPDSAFSLEPRELKEMVEAIRTVEQAAGSVHYGINLREAKSKIFRRSLFIVNDMKADEAFTEDNVRSIRPGHGLHPRYFDEILGRRASCPIERGTPLSWDLVAAAAGEPGADRDGRGLPSGSATIRLRSMDAEDAVSVVQWRNDPSVAAQFFSERPPTMAEHQAWFAAAGKSAARQEFMIVLRESERAIGTVGLSRIDPDNGEAEYGILMGDHQYRGNGKAYEASRLILDRAFRTLALRRVVLNCFSDNLPACKLYERLGFVKDVTSSGERIKDGVARTTISMYLDRSAWEKKEASNAIC
jgi:RimJ/RimL family protein N-acetyltransferase